MKVPSALFRGLRQGGTPTLHTHQAPTTQSEGLPLNQWTDSTRFTNGHSQEPETGPRLIEKRSVLPAPYREALIMVGRRLRS
jgi:hypothetical protein